MASRLLVFKPSGAGLLSNQGDFIRVPLRKKALKYGTPKPSE